MAYDLEKKANWGERGSGLGRDKNGWGQGSLAVIGKEVDRARPQNRGTYLKKTRGKSFLLYSFV